MLARQSLAHNIATIEELCRQVLSWQDHRNQYVGTVNGQFRAAGNNFIPCDNLALCLLKPSCGYLR